MQKAVQTLATELSASEGDVLSLDADLNPTLAAPAGGGGGGGAFETVSCVLVCDVLDVSVAPSGGAAVQFQWQTVVADVWNFGDLAGVLPDGLGITFADASGNPTDLAGSDGTLVTTEAGVWSFALFLTFQADATFKGQVTDGGNAQTLRGPFVTAGNGYQDTVSVTHYFPEGTWQQWGIVPIVQSTASPYHPTGRLEIVRLA